MTFFAIGVHILPLFEMFRSIKILSYVVLGSAMHILYMLSREVISIEICNQIALIFSIHCYRAVLYHHHKVPVCMRALSIERSDLKRSNS